MSSPRKVTVPHDAPTGSTPPGIPRSVIDVLDSLRDVPGLLEAAVLAPRRGRVIGTARTDTGVGPLLEWARRTHEVSIERGHEIEDVIVTSTRSHHVVRMAILPGEGPVWVAVRVDLEYGTLAMVRRRLALLGRDVRPLPAGPRRAPAPLPVSGVVPAPTAPLALPTTAPTATHVVSPPPADAPPPPARHAPPIPARLLAPAPAARERASEPELVPALASLPPLPTATAPPPRPARSSARAAGMAALAASAVASVAEPAPVVEPATAEPVTAEPVTAEPAPDTDPMAAASLAAAPVAGAAAVAVPAAEVEPTPADTATPHVPAPRKPWRPTALIEPYTVPPPALEPEEPEEPDETEVPVVDTSPDTPDAEPAHEDEVPALPTRRPGAGLPGRDDIPRAARRRPDESALKRVLVGLRRLA